MLTENKIKYSEYGFYHNEALYLLEVNEGNLTNKNTGQIIDYLSKLLEKKYPEKFTNVDVTKAKKLFGNYGYKKFNYSNFVTLWEQNKENLYVTNSIPKKTGAIIDKIIANNLSYDETLSEIINTKKSANLTQFEINSLTAMESLLRSSYSYWSSRSSASSQRLAASGDWIADIVVGVFFSESGPLSIIAGGLVSKFVSSSGQ